MRAGPIPLALAAVLLASLALAGCATGTAPDARISPSTQVNNPALATVPGIPVVRNVPYVADGDPAHTLDACTPPVDPADTDPAPRAAIVEVHRGGWTSGDKATLGYRAICQWLASEGYVVFDLDYRLAPAHPYPAGIDDVRAAVEWIRQPAQAARWNIDPARLGAFGGSAGGNLVALLGTDGSGAWTSGTRVAAVVEMSGPVDLTGAHVTADFLPEQLSYLHCPSEQDCPVAEDASPQDQVDRTDPPFFVTHSSDETKIPLGQSQQFVKRLRAAGVDTTFVIVQGSAHSIAMMNDDLKTRIAAFYQRTLGG